MFTIFCIVAAWMLPLPYWLQVCLTVFGVLAILIHSNSTIIHYYSDR